MNKTLAFTRNNLRRSTTSASICALLALLQLAPALADNTGTYVVFDSIPPTVRTGQGGATINADPRFDYTIFATEFTPSSSGTLSSIDMFVWRAGFSFDNGQIDVSLRPNSLSGYPSETILTSGMITAPDNSLQPVLTTFLPSGPLALYASTPYWLVLAPHNSTSFAGWEYSTASTGQGHRTRPRKTGPASTSPAHQITRASQSSASA